MDKIDLEREYSDLTDEIKVGSVAEHELQVTEFFNIYSQLAAENGDAPDLEYCPILGESNPRYRIDGYALDIIEGGNTESGDLYLVVCDFRQEDKIFTLNAKDIDRSVDLAVRFYRQAMSDEFLGMLEESSPAYQLTLLIRQYGNRISRVRVVVFSNGHLRTRRNVFDTRELGLATIHTNVIDLERYAKISLTGSEPIEVNFDEDFGGAIECLSPSTGTDSYLSYLFSVPGSVLAEIFAAFGNRLLEQNVRTYLQARTNVNKGILKTISDEPAMFFAYNNGVTATASSVNTRQLTNGALAISHIKDFQIVNGGQTTASLLYARDGQKKDLSHVHVQVKLSVVDEDQIKTVVPKISEYANTQNKVSLSDLASNSPAQIKIQRLSKEVSVPQKAGHLHAVKWFYERSRGQYKSLFAYKTSPERKKLELEYPRDHLITKTDLAKYEYSFDGLPYVVSMGAQKCFLKFTNTLTKMSAGDGSALNDNWYKRAIAKAILFKSLDASVQQSDWYKEDRGYKAQIVTYTIAACADGFRRKGSQINLDRIWDDQAVPDCLMAWMLREAEKLSLIIKNPPADVRNISEYAKKPHCWEVGVSGRVGVPDDSLLDFGISIDVFQDEARSGKKEARKNKEVDFDVALANLVPQSHEIKQRIEMENAQSPKNMSAINKLMMGNLNLNKGEKNALKMVLERLEIEY